MTAPYTEWQTWLIVSTCGLIVIGTIVGNVLVCTAVAIVRRLRTPSNLLIVSLAVSDLLVAVLVMPLAAAYETTGSWEHGQPVCDMWTSLDVMLCTASILNLCAISIDR
jgi:5-hydroxytryptamine receptor 7